MSDWNIDKAAELYQVNRWGKGFFGINAAGHAEVQLEENQRIDLKQLVDDLKANHGLHAPLLLRFSDILKGRMQALHGSFAEARAEAGYEGRYYGVYPIKVNQQYQVVEEIVDFGTEFNWGLEAGSKPELHATLAMLEDVEGLIVCNGYKDREFIYLALLGVKMGKQVFIVVEKSSEIDLIIEIAGKMGVRPLIGLRAKLAATGSGRWEDSGGDRSKFGLSAGELLAAVEKLEAHGFLDCIRMLHFHIGSQVTAIRQIKIALQEIGRFYVELRKLGAPVDFIDVGGGLGVDYDGSAAGTPSSIDYSMQEYANDIIWSLKNVCEEEELPHPNIVSESGRSLVAHHAMLVVNVLGVSRRGHADALPGTDEDAPLQLQMLRDALGDLSAANAREFYHDAGQFRDDMHRLFALGHCSLTDRAAADALYWQIIDRIRELYRNDEYLKQELKEIERLVADRYFCNFSIFQSLPDSWAIDQTFPILPIHRLDEQPTRQASLVDITCDSDGKIERFPGGQETRATLPLHELKTGEDYLIGIFLVGAYQEILGDLHNLFGDTHAVHVTMEDGQYHLQQIVEGESVSEVLDYVQFHEKVLTDRMKRQLQSARAAKRLTAREANDFLNFYREGLRGYTYLEEHLPHSATAGSK